MKHPFLAILSIVLVVVVASCSDSSSSSSSETTEVSSTVDMKMDSVAGMVRVSANGATSVLGTNSYSSKMIERPKMKVELTYDFSIGRHEVICKDFNDVMSDETGLTVNCPSDSIPASNVTFFDAVLYANAVSRQKGLDSSYVYSSAEFDYEKHCVKLDGFKFLTEANGFRLPTEAEWILAASQSWNPQQGWHGSNAEARAHEVCTSNENKTYLCDMAGNMLEWVNDWLGSFRDTVVSNFVGATDGGVLGSCVVKGGNFYSDPSTMELFKRGDTYPVLFSSRSDYVGFRLAYGSIPDAVWFSNSGNAVSVPVVPLVDGPGLKKLTKSYKAGLAFRNDESGNLVYVNYSSDHPTVVEIQDTLDVYHPEISPNGRYVAFCTSIEGSSAVSSVYVRSLTGSDSKVLKLDVERASIPRWLVTPQGDTVIVYVTSAGNNKGEQFKKESTWMVPFEKEKFGTPQKLFDGAYHGGVLPDNSLAVSGSPLLRARLKKGASVTDTVWYDEAQACNASLAKDGSNRTLFLDFGGSKGRKFSGENYGVHEQLLIVDETGKIIQMVPAPKGYAFDHSEWVGGILGDSASSLVVATLNNSDGVHGQIVLVNLSDSSVVPLVDGGELWHPSLWIQQENSTHPKPSVDLDSAGVYFKNDPTNPFSFSSVELGMHLQTFWKICDQVEVATLGSSMLLDAVIADSIKSYKTINMGVTLADVYMFEHLVKNYILPYAPQIKVLVVELSPGLMYRNYESMFQYVVNFSPGLVYDIGHLSEKTKMEIANNSAYQEYPKDLFSQQYIEGTFQLPSGNWSVPAVSVDISSITFESPRLQNSLKVFESIKNMADSHGVKLVAAITPRNPAYASSPAFDLFGPSWDVAHQVIDAVKEMDVLVFDENKDGNHDYPDAMAFNTNHVSYLGAQQFSARLDSLLRTLR